MTTELDRLLELWHKYRVAVSTGEVDFSDEESKEFQSLKSQIESNLAQAEKYDRITDYERVNDPRLFASESFRKIEQELSQLRPIVQKIKEDPDIKQAIWNINNVIANPEEENQYFRKAIDKLQSILASSEDKK